MPYGVAIIDTCCPKPYDHDSLKVGGIGGTEATVIRVAEVLPHHTVVLQHNKEETTISNNYVVYRGFKRSDLKEPWAAIVVLRDPKAAVALRKEFKEADQCLLWLHDVVTPTFAKYVAELTELDIDIVCVSEWQKVQLLDIIRDYTTLKRYPVIHVISNPIDEALVPDLTPVDEYKLVYFSSPHKGLTDALALFRNLVDVEPKFKFRIANPGYYPSLNIDGIPNVTVLGELSHEEVMKEVRGALCVFYPNFVFPETFGLVMAEANAVGTPVLTHDLGAAREVLSNPSAEIVDCKNKYRVLTTVLGWAEGGRPVVQAQERFRISKVKEEWRHALC